MDGMKECECEHKAHFNKREVTPNGNPSHMYGTKFYVTYIKPCKTNWGTFNLCNDCYEDCYYTERVG